MPVEKGTALKLGDLMGTLKSVRKLGFVVFWDGRTIKLELDENATVLDLRRAIQERTKVRRSRQQIRPADDAVAKRTAVKLGLTIDATKLKDLKLNQNCRLILEGEADDGDFFDPSATQTERDEVRRAAESAAGAAPERFRDKPPLERAAHYRDEGNAAFGAGRPEKACDFYTQAINAVGSRAGRGDDNLGGKCLSNRAACYLKLKRYAEAAWDAERAIELNRAWAKPYGRLGQAMLMLRKYDEAAEAYERGLAACGEDGGLREGLDQAQAKGGDSSRAIERRERERCEAAERRKAFENAARLPVYRSPHNNDGKKLSNGFESIGMQGGVVDGSNVAKFTAMTDLNRKRDRAEKEKRGSERELTAHKWRVHVGPDGPELDETSCDLFNDVRGRCTECLACEGYFAKLGSGHNDTSSFLCMRCGCGLQSHTKIGRCPFFDHEDPKYRRHRCGAGGEIVNPFSLPREMRERFGIEEGAGP